MQTNKPTKTSPQTNIRPNIKRVLFFASILLLSVGCQTYPQQVYRQPTSEERLADGLGAMAAMQSINNFYKMQQMSTVNFQGAPMRQQQVQQPNQYQQANPYDSTSGFFGQ
jgi:hypothetical protein